MSNSFIPHWFIRSAIKITGEQQDEGKLAKLITHCAPFDFDIIQQTRNKVSNESTRLVSLFEIAVIAVVSIVAARRRRGGGGLAVEALAVVLDLPLGDEGAHDLAHGRAHEVPLRARQIRRRLDDAPDGLRAAVERLLQPRVVDHLLQRDEGAHAGLQGRALEPLHALNHPRDRLQEAADAADDLRGVGQPGKETTAAPAAAPAPRQSPEEGCLSGEVDAAASRSTPGRSRPAEEAAEKTASAAAAARTRSAKKRGFAGEIEAAEETSSAAGTAVVAAGETTEGPASPGRGVDPRDTSGHGGRRGGGERGGVR